ncbi:hypothetical protein [Bosea sp. (in: a-proteobacteria)]|uniref:hypothetical protein n=1 Tax=Bosea sp. (in: a-proteobacteria) TaxID=1871050 RepID=UPI000ABA4368|nr:hypothetical protein [Bosea sp. (in: a-proteobacteria)]
MNWNTHAVRAAALRRLALLLCAIGSSLVIPQASTAQENAALVLPKREEELAGKRIGWRFDDVTGALTQANTDGKPLVLIFIAEPCGWCRIFLAHVLRCDGFNTLAGQAHFAILTDVARASASSGDEEQKQLRRLLKVEGFPTTSVVSVKAGTITPVAKFAGVASEASLLEYLSKAGLKALSGTGTATQQAAVGLPRPAACGTTNPEAALEASSPRRVQRGLSP